MYQAKETNTQKRSDSKLYIGDATESNITWEIWTVKPGDATSLWLSHPWIYQALGVHSSTEIECLFLSEVLELGLRYNPLVGFMLWKPVTLPQLGARNTNAHPTRLFWGATCRGLHRPRSATATSDIPDIPLKNLHWKLRTTWGCPTFPASLKCAICASWLIPVKCPSPAWCDVWTTEVL